MGTINFNINKNNNLYVLNKENQNNNLFKKGNIIEGTITYKDAETVKVSANNITLNLKTSEVLGSVDDKVKFEVLGNENSSFILKQLKNTTSFENVYHSELAEKISNDDLLEMLKKNNYVKNADQSELDEEALKEKQLLIEVQRALKFGGKNISSSVLAKAQANGLSLDKISITTLSKIIGESSVATVKDKSSKEMKELENSLKETLAPEEASLKTTIANSLNDSGFEVTNDNINSIYETVKTLSSLQDNSKNIDIKNILKKELPLTVQNIQSNTHQKASSLSSGKDINENLQSNIAKRLEDLGLNTDDNIDLAKSFIANEIPLTEENINKYNFLMKELSKMSTDDLVSLAINSVRTEQPTENIDLSSISNLKIDKSILSFLNKIQTSEVTDETFLYLEENDIEFTLKNVLENIQTQKDTEIELSKESIKQKRYFFEAQLKLTLENINTLRKNGINVNTSSLQQVVESLKSLENDFAIATIEEFGTLATKENIDLFTATTSYVDELKLKNPQLLIKAIESENLTLNSLKPTKSFLEDYTNQMDWQLSKTSGKSNFKKVEGKIEELLDKLSIPKTEDNISSVGILIRNNMDVTDESIEQVSTVISKLNYIKEELTPKVISKMLNDGINPLEENIDDLISYTESFKEIYGESNNDKLINELVKLNKDRKVSEDTKDAIKSIYKALNLVSKNGIASVGSTLKDEKALTLETLIATSKNFDKHHSTTNTFDVTLEDDTAYTVSTTNKDFNISTIAQKGVKFNKNSLDIQEFIDNANYEGLKNYIEENQDYLKELLPVITMKLKKATTTTDLSSIKELTENIASTSSETISYLFRNKGNLSKNNINAFSTLEKDENALTKNLAELLDNSTTLNFGSELDENLPLDIASGKLLDIAIGEVKKADIPIEKLDLSKKTVDLLQMQSFINEKEDKYYSFPIKLESTGELTNVNMLLTSENSLDKDNIKVHFSLFTNKLKDITVDADIDKVEKSISLEINCSNRSASLLQEEEKTFKDLLSENGYENVTIIYNNKDAINVFKGLKGITHGK